MVFGTCRGILNSQPVSHTEVSLCNFIESVNYLPRTWFAPVHAMQYVRGRELLYLNTLFWYVISVLFKYIHQNTFIWNTQIVSCPCSTLQPTTIQCNTQLKRKIRYPRVLRYKNLDKELACFHAVHNWCGVSLRGYCIKKKMPVQVRWYWSSKNIIVQNYLTI